MFVVNKTNKINIGIISNIQHHLRTKHDLLVGISSTFLFASPLSSSFIILMPYATTYPLARPIQSVKVGGAVNDLIIIY